MTNTAAIGEKDSNWGADAEKAPPKKNYPTALTPLEREITGATTRCRHTRVTCVKVT